MTKSDIKKMIERYIYSCDKPSIKIDGYDRVIGSMELHLANRLMGIANISELKIIFKLAKFIRESWISVSVLDTQISAIVEKTEEIIVDYRNKK